MTSLNVNDKVVSISVSSATIAINFCNDELSDKLLTTKCDSTETSVKIQDGSVPITCSDVSHDSKLLVFCSHKDISIWETDSWRLVGQNQLKRTANNVKFSPKSDKIVVSDKSGDVYMYSSKNFSEDSGKLILGHVSIILDLLITLDEELIVTCDRDEKIRISRFPHGYYIERYCLGHKEFVISLCLLSHNDKCLVSSGGDGTLRFWDFHKGIQLTEHKCLDIKLPNDDCSEDKPCILTKIVSLDHKPDVSFICATINKFNGFIIYKVSSKIDQINCTVHQTVKLDEEPLGICLNRSTNKLWLLQGSSNLIVYSLVESDQIKECNEDNVEKLNLILNKYKEVFSDAFSTSKLIGLYYKKSIDNIQEYLKRKVERIENNTKKLKV